MTRMSSARVSSARGLAAIAVLGIVALGGTSACASSATTAGGSGTATGSPSVGGSPTPTLIPLPSPSAPSSPAGPAGPGSTAPSGIKAASYSNQGDTLTVQFIAGVCATYSLQADQSTPGTVRVTILATPKTTVRQVCPMLEKQQSATAHLDSPLDQRKVVDAVSGQTLAPAVPVSGGTKVTHGPIKQ